jgi:ligand-binding sensor domain-containing protein
VVLRDHAPLLRAVFPFRRDGVLHPQELSQRRYHTPAFRSHDLVGLYVSHDGDLWTGGRDGWVYRLRDGAWTAHDLTDILPRHWVQGFAEDADGTLWMGSTGPVVARFDGTSWTRVPQRIRDVWTPLVADPSGTIWTMLEKTVLEDDSATGASESYLNAGIVARWNGQRFVPAQDEGLLGFIPTQNGPLFHRVADPEAARTSRGRVRVELMRADGTPCGWYWTRRDHPAFARLVDRQGRVWVQPWNGTTRGTITIERDGVELGRIEPAGGTWVEQVFEDRQGNVWVHSRSSGLLQVHEEPFRRFTTDEGAHLYRRLQELLDESPSSLFRSIRLERAAQLLEQRAGTVGEIAYGVGFKNFSHFSCSFRTHFGHVPSEHAARFEPGASEPGASEPATPSESPAD